MMTGVTEILVVVALVAVFFGPGKLPQVMESLGQGLKTFKQSANETRKGEDDDATGGSAPKA